MSIYIYKWCPGVQGLAQTTRSKCQIRRSVALCSAAPPFRPSRLLVTYPLSTRFNVRYWRRLPFILLLVINLCTISILYPHPFNDQATCRWNWKLSDTLSLHRLQSDGRLEVNMEGRHPILELMALGEAKWTRMIQRYSSFPSIQCNLTPYPQAKQDSSGRSR